MPDRLDAEHEQENTDGGEDPGFDHGDGMQERADRSGSHHGGGQPAVHRHYGVLGKTKQEQRKDDIQKRRLRCQRRRRQDAAAAEVEGSRHVVNQDDGRHEQQLGRTQKINDVLARAGLGLACLLVRHQGIGGQRQSFIEQEQGKEVGRECHTHGGGQRQGEAGEVARLCVLAERAHVAD